MAAKDKPESVLHFLENKTVSLKELQAAFPPLDIGLAWAAGEIQFGRRTYVREGPTNHSDLPATRAGSRIVVEPGMEWTGKKTNLHLDYEEMNLEALPEAETYRRPDIPRTKVTDTGINGSGAEYTEMGRITKDEAHKLLGVVVKLTDFGRTELQKMRRAAVAA